MSGLAVIVERDGAPAVEARITGMLERLQHRGPALCAHRCSGSVALGQRTLVITDEDALQEGLVGKASRDLWIVADARLDNRAELLAARRAGGEGDEPLSDAGLILWAYERWGVECPLRLLGDFAFAIWDGAERRLFCARDHLGIRPFYYHRDGRAFRAASEMHALFADSRVPRRPSRRAMALFLTYQYTEAKETLWSGIEALRPGHRLTVTEGSIREDAYFRLDPTRRVHHSSDDAYAEHFREVFSEAVRCRLRARGPVAAQVSGGLDSSSVACEASRLQREGDVAGEPLLLMRCVYPGLECDEQPYSQAVADRLGLPILSVAPAEDPELCRPALSGLDPDGYFDPLGRAEALLVTLAKERGARAMLTGMGGDHLLRGTGVEGADALRRGHIGEAIRSAGLMARPLSPTAWKTLLRDGLTAFTPRALSRIRRYRAPARARWPWVSPSIAREAQEHEDEIDQQTLDLSPEPVMRDLTGMLASFLNLSMPLAHSDRLAARAGIEFRHPFFDVRLVELLLAFPHAQRFDPHLSKPVLRRAMRGVLPDLIRERRPITYFNCYIRRCLFEEHGDAVRRLLMRGMLEQRGALDGAEVERRLRARGSDEALMLLHPLALELWLQRWYSFTPTQQGSS